jgi:hypothetical protein
VSFRQFFRQKIVYSKIKSKKIRGSMGAYSKNVAVIKTLRQGFSADGGPLSGLVRVEKYGLTLRVEISFINFAPLTEGRLVTGVSDGKTIEFIEGAELETESPIVTGGGFAALICFVHKTVLPIASAVCGNFSDALAGIAKALEKREQCEGVESGKSSVAYEDEAIAEDNYYEYNEVDAQRNAVYTDSQKEEADGQELSQNEGNYHDDQVRQNERAAWDDEVIPLPLSEGKAFYDKVQQHVQSIFEKFAPYEELNGRIKHSKWVKIPYGEDRHYVFGVLYQEEVPRYIAYGIWGNAQKIPESLKGYASFVPMEGEGEGACGYWVMYQDAGTGATIPYEYL